MAQKAWKVPLKRLSSNRRVLSKAGGFQCRPTRVQRLCLPCSHAPSTAPRPTASAGSRVRELGPLALPRADQRSQRVAGDLIVRLRPLKRLQDLPDVIHRECTDFLLHPGLGRRRVVGGRGGAKA
jgi:hypothetical protein